MKGILVTGFDPFGGESINPAQKLLEALEGEVHTCLLPTSYDRSIRVLENALEQLHPRVLLSIGQAGGRSALTLERVGINWMEAGIADNDGCLYKGRPIETAAPGGYLTTLDLPQLLEAAHRAGVPAHVSLSAGTFVCNRILYGGLHWAANHAPDMKAGFLHVPFLPEQVIDRPNTASMDFDTMLHGVRAMLEVL